MIKIKYFILFLIFTSLYSNFVSGVCITHFDFGSKLPVIKDLFLLILINLFIYVYICKEKTKIVVNKHVIIFLIAIILLTFVSNDGIYNKIYNVRRIILPLVILIIFQNINIKTNKKSLYFKFIVFNFFTFSFFGLFEYFFGELVWKNLISINRYWASNAIESRGYIDWFTEGGRMYTSDTIKFIGFKARRMISFALEPTTLGAFYLFLTTYFLYNKNYLIFFICLTVGMLILSKLVFVGIFLLIFQKVFNLYHHFFIILGFLVLFLLSHFIYIETNRIHGSFNHIKGFYTGVTLLSDHPLGFGVGVAGNRGSSKISTSTGDYGGESGFGNLTAQVGYLGVYYLFIIYILWKKLYNKGILCTVSKMNIALLSQYLLNFLLSASSMGFLSIYFIFMHIGLTCNKNE